MGMYDYVTIGDKEGQVKLWFRTMQSYTVGSLVPSINGYKTYSVAMREGGYVNVVNNVIQSWTDNPESDMIYDKWGYVFDPKTTDSLGTPYFFNEVDSVEP